MEDVNLELQLLADEAKIERVQMEYDLLMEEMMLGHEMQMYASHSYDLDAAFFGEA